MRHSGWSVVALFAIAGACQGSKVEDGPAAPAAAGASASTASGGSAGAALVIGLAATSGALNVGGTSVPSAGGREADSSAVTTPVVRCHDGSAAGGQGAGGDDAGGAGGAAWDDECLPPASQCVGDLTLVYFDEGQCVSGFCTWQKRSLDCYNRCQGRGCQDSITTK